MNALKDTINRLVLARKQAGMTQEDVALRMGVSPITVSRWETGTRQISLELFFDLAQLYGALPAALMSDDIGAHEARVLPFDEVSA